ncbi:glutamic acid-rich protein [Eurytemora carolleeae]|uniref:glutamic acid-rich protein n=1 Tax=Eurytemora carolleeae TaxID=1294199 RepID=UPI000C75DD05|nr:glutamic acid-rich protein [Eurytemora carolleeae]|eukprot:XP_023333451.1 glutamic acid-rich protein-like [Eurytemora affinis]
MPPKRKLTQKTIKNFFSSDLFRKTKSNEINKVAASSTLTLSDSDPDDPPSFFDPDGDPTTKKIRKSRSEDNESFTLVDHNINSIKDTYPWGDDNDEDLEVGDKSKQIGDDWDMSKQEDQEDRRKPEDQKDRRKPEDQKDMRKPDDQEDMKKPENQEDRRKPEDQEDMRKPKDQEDMRKPEDQEDRRKPEDQDDIQKPEDQEDRRKPEDQEDMRKPKDQEERRNPEDQDDRMC